MVLWFTKHLQKQMTRLSQDKTLCMSVVLNDAVWIRAILTVHKDLTFPLHVSR